MPLKDGSYKGPHLASRKALLEMLKLEGELTCQEMAKRLGVSSMAARQHMLELEEGGDVSSVDRPRGKGRPSKYWFLTSKASRHFPDRHRELILDVLDGVRSSLGEEAMQGILKSRARKQLAIYRGRLEGVVAWQERVRVLASFRSEEGYMTEVLEEGPALILVENHCPICEAARSCDSLCGNELEVFRACLGDGFSVERIEHILSGQRRCAYRVEPR